MANPSVVRERNAAMKKVAWKRWIKPWHIVSLAALAIALYFFWNWWVSPEHRIAQFQAAVSSGNLTAMMALASPDEVSHLGLTNAKLNAMLVDASQSPGGIRLIHPRTKPIGPTQAHYNRWLAFDVTDPQGRLVYGPDGHVVRALSSFS